jgi:hypothetical protein
MKLTNLREVSEYEVYKWLKTEIELTERQKEYIEENEIFRFAPFYFSKKYEVKKVNPLLRLSIVLIPIVYVLLIVGMFFNFLIFGKWQYEFKYVKWFSEWLNKIGL